MNTSKPSRRVPPAAVEVAMSVRKLLIAFVAGLLVAGCAAPVARLAPDEARRQVIAVERAFAKTMADRDHRAFATFVAQDTVFFSGPKPLRGKVAVVEFWARFYKDPQAPFSWEPDEVEVLDSGTLAISSGPVRNPRASFRALQLDLAAGSAGPWRVVFDRANRSAIARKSAAPPVLNSFPGTRCPGSTVFMSGSSAKGIVTSSSFLNEGQRQI